MSERFVYYYIRLYRVSDSDREIVEREVRKLCEFLKHRSRLARDVSYYVVTFIDNGESDGLILVSSKRGDTASREVDMLISFIESDFETLRAEVLDKVKNTKLIPIPISRNF